MKKLTAIMMITLLIWGCAKKMTPAKTEIPASNTGYSGNNMGAPTANNNESNKNPDANPNSDLSAQGSKSATRPDLTGRSPEERSAIAGQQTYNAKCGKCHNLKVTTDYTRDRWLSIMQVEAMRCNLSDIEKENITTYVTLNCKK